MPWQPNPVEFPDAELVVTANLRPLLDADVFVGRAIPAQRRDRMVIVNRDGGFADGVTDRPRIRLRIWDVSDQAANNLARRVCALMQRLVGAGGVTRVDQQSGPYEVPDESGGHQRYALFELRTEGTQLS